MTKKKITVKFSVAAAIVDSVTGAPLRIPAGAQKDEKEDPVSIRMVYGRGGVVRCLDVFN